VTIESRGMAWRISLHFAALFIVPGVYLPFFAVWLESRSLAPTQISIMLSVGILMRLLAGPMAAHVVDRSGRRKTALILLAWASLASFALLGWVDGFAAMLLVWVVHCAAWAPVTPFSDNIALLASTRHGLHYGRMRLWGSIGSRNTCSAGSDASNSAGRPRLSGPNSSASPAAKRTAWQRRVPLVLSANRRGGRRAAVYAANPSCTCTSAHSR